MELKVDEEGICFSKISRNSESHLDLNKLGVILPKLSKLGAKNNAYIGAKEAAEYAKMERRLCGPSKPSRNKRLDMSLPNIDTTKVETSTKVSP